MYNQIIDFIRDLFPGKEKIPLHEPLFVGNEKNYILDAIDSTFVSYVGEYVDRFEKMSCDITGSNYAVAVVNGSVALHMALLVAGVTANDEVITQPLTFVATANAIMHVGAKPIFLDIERLSLGLSPESVEQFLNENAEMDIDGSCVNKKTGRRIAACMPVHIFGHPCRISEIVCICKNYNIPVIEDAAEALGSLYRDKHVGTFGLMGIFSFNGNKTITCGGGGIIVTNDEKLARQTKHITSTAKVSHPYEYIHDQLGYNYRLPNLNAAVACAQLELLDQFIQNKRQLSHIYKDFFKSLDIPFIEEPMEAKSNYWLNSILLPDKTERDRFLKASNSAAIMTRPVWRLANKLPMYGNCQTDNLRNSKWFEDRIVNIPSSVRLSYRTE